MVLGESINISLDAIRANKLRSALTLLGIIIGMTTIIGMQSLVSGLQRSMEEQLTILGSSTFQVQKFPVIRTDRETWMRLRNRKDLTLREYDALQEYTNLAKQVGAEAWDFGNSVLRYANRKTLPTFQVAGGTPEFLDNNGYLTREGRFISQVDVDHNRHVIVLGQDLVDRLFPNEDPLQKEVRLNATRFEVIGTLEPRGQSFGNSQDNLVVIPIGVFFDLYGSKRSIHITVMAKSAQVIESAIEQVIGILRAVRKVAPGEDNDFEIFSSQTLIDAFNNLTMYVRLAAIAIASISLIVAGVGIMNIMLVSVTERTREIGIRKALGATRRQILMQFLIEAIILCEIGGVIGIAIGIGIGQLISAISPLPTVVPVWSVFLGLFFCSLVGLFFGIYPATRAARLDPIDALRYE
jgi:putative ABC transport system permease protein